jgi:predicted dehydrogenase
MLRERMRGWESTTKLTFDGELHDFLRLVKGEPGVSLADGWSGVRANEIAQAVYSSSREGRAVTLAPVGSASS